VSKLLSLTPVPNLLMLGKLMGFLKKVAHPANRNKMDAKNLAICFGPNLLYPRVETMETVIGNAMHVTNLITMFIEVSEVSVANGIRLNVNYHNRNTTFISTRSQSSWRD